MGADLSQSLLELICGEQAKSASAHPKSESLDVASMAIFRRAVQIALGRDKRFQLFGCTLSDDWQDNAKTFCLDGTVRS